MTTQGSCDDIVEERKSFASGQRRKTIKSVIVHTKGISADFI